MISMLSSPDSKDSGCRGRFVASSVKNHRRSTHSIQPALVHFWNWFLEREKQISTSSYSRGRFRRRQSFISSRRPASPYYPPRPDEKPEGVMDRFAQCREGIPTRRPLSGASVFRFE